MRRRRKYWMRRFALGLAVAALVAPAAQARIDEGTVTQGTEPAVVIHGDDKVIVAGTGGSSVPIHDDKVIVDGTGGSSVPIHDDKVILPAPGTYTLAGYRRALPEDYGTRTVVPVAAVHAPSSFDWGDALVGAGAAFGLMLLAGAAVFAARRSRPVAA